MEKRLTRLENLVYSLIKRIDNDKFYAKADHDTEKINISNNASNVAENSEGIFDIAEVAGENSEGMFDLAEMVADLENRVTELEEKNNG